MLVVRGVTEGSNMWEGITARKKKKNTKVFAEYSFKYCSTLVTSSNQNTPPYSWYPFNVAANTHTYKKRIKMFKRGKKETVYNVKEVRPCRSDPW